MITVGYMKKIKKIEYATWLKPEQKKYLINMRYNQIIEDEEIKALIQEKIDEDLIELKREVRELKRENKSLKFDNGIMSKRLEVYEKRRTV